MNAVALQLPADKQLILLTGYSSAQTQMLKISAHLALTGGANIIDGGNQFNAYQVARHIRHKTRHVSQCLETVRITRSFNCYQMVTILSQVTTCCTPVVIFDLLSSFYDENVPYEESVRLLGITFRNLIRIRKNTIVIASARFPKISSPRENFFLGLRELASITWEVPENINPWR